jgi:transglutaminase-like putative cysteine protease
LRLRLKHVNLDGFSLDGGRQKRSGDVVEITLEKLENARSYQLPCTDKRLGQYLEATPFIQSTDKNIMAMAQQIIGADRDARSAARKICQWMQSAVEKMPTMSVPSAAEVLRSRSGDCNEHAVLFAALCRAAGIPARICAGIVYLNGSFFYHAWNEVYLDGWISIDSTTNQFPADVTHVKFVEGDLEQQILILKIVGKMAIDVLEYS